MHKPTALGALCLLVLGLPAQAQTDTDDFNVQITIEAECAIDSATDLDFGTAGILATDIDAESAVSVTCSNGTDYELALNAGQGTGATVDTRYMSNGASETIEYSLYQDAARTLVWGETAGTNTVSATGTGQSQAHDVYGRVPAQDTPTAGTYTDIVTATVTY